MTVLRFRKNDAQKVHLPLAPLVDILANLAFFFMIQASFGASSEQIKETAPQPSHLIESLVVEIGQKQISFDHDLLLQSKEAHPLSPEQKAKLRGACESFFESAQVLSQKRWVQEAWVDVVVAPGVPYSRVDDVTAALKDVGFNELRYRVQSTP